MPETTPTSTQAPAAATPVAKPSFTLRSKLLFKKYQNVNGKGMNEIDAENAARSELGLPALTEAEIAQLQKRDNLMKKVKNSKVLAAIGSLGFIKKIRAKVEGTPAPAAAPIPTVVATPVAPAAQTLEANSQPKVGV